MVAQGLTEAEARAAQLAGRLARPGGQGAAPTSPSTNCRTRTIMRRSAISSTAIRRSSRPRSSASRRSAARSRPRCWQTMAAAQRAADRFRAVQPDLEGGMHRRRGLPPHRRPRAVRLRQSVRPGDARRQDLRAAPGQQLLHLPGRRPRRDRQRRAAHHRRDVHGGRAHAGASWSPKRTSRRAASIRRCRASARSRRTSPPRLPRRLPARLAAGAPPADLLASSIANVRPALRRLRVIAGERPNRQGRRREPRTRLPVRPQRHRGRATGARRERGGGIAPDGRR